MPAEAAGEVGQAAVAGDQRAEVVGLGCAQQRVVFSAAVPGELGRQTLAERLADPGAVQACVRATIRDVVS